MYKYILRFIIGIIASGSILASCGPHDLATKRLSNRERSVDIVLADREDDSTTQVVYVLPHESEIKGDPVILTDHTYGDNIYWKDNNTAVFEAKEARFWVYKKHSDVMTAIGNSVSINIERQVGHLEPSPKDSGL
jgi:hypothetical protein